MTDRLRLWARIAMATALALVAVGIATSIHASGLADRGGSEESQSLRTIDAVLPIIAVLAILANLVAFTLALICWVRRSGQVPWIVLGLSALGAAYTVYLGLAEIGIVRQ